MKRVNRKGVKCEINRKWLREKEAATVSNAVHACYK